MSTPTTKSGFVCHLGAAVADHNIDQLSTSCSKALSDALSAITACTEGIEASFLPSDLVSMQESLQLLSTKHRELVALISNRHVTRTSSSTSFVETTTSGTSTSSTLAEISVQCPTSHSTSSSQTTPLLGSASSVGAHSYTNTAVPSGFLHFQDEFRGIHHMLIHLCDKTTQFLTKTIKNQSGALCGCTPCCIGPSGENKKLKLGSGSMALISSLGKQLQSLYLCVEFGVSMLATCESGEVESWNFPYAPSAPMYAQVDGIVAKMDRAEFFAKMGKHYAPDLRKFYEILIVTTASSKAMWDTKNAHVKDIKFGSAQMYWACSDGDKRAERVIEIYDSVTLERARLVWELMDESPMVSTAIAAANPSVKTSKTFFIPARPLDAAPRTPSLDLPIIPRCDISGLPTEYVSTLPPVAARYISNRKFKFVSPQPKKSVQITTTPSKDPSDLLIFHVHGGGFISGSSFGHECYTRVWARKLNAPVLSIDYRKAPEHPFPTALHEVYSAYLWALENLDTLGVTGKKVVVIGDSAGGNFVAALTLKLMADGLRVPDALVMAYPALYLLSTPSPARLVSVFDPMVNFAFLRMCMDSYAPQHLGIDASNPFVSPGCAPDEYLAALPPVYITAGSLDPLFDDSASFARRVARVNPNVKFEVWDTLAHGYLNLQALVPEAKAANENLMAWVSATVGAC